MKGQTKCRAHGGATQRGRAAGARRQQEAEVRGFLESQGAAESVDHLEALEELLAAKHQEVKVLQWAVRQKEQDQLTWGVASKSTKTGKKAGVRTIEQAGLTVLLTWMHTAERDLLAVIAMCDKAGMTAKRKEYLERVGGSVAVAMRTLVTLLVGRLTDLDAGDTLIHAIQSAGPDLARQALLTLDPGQQST